MPRPIKFLVAAVAAIIVLSAGLCAGAGASRAAEPGAEGGTQDVAPAPPPPAYEAQLMQLAQLLGSIDYLRQLCEKEGGTDWRETMKTVIDTEAKGEQARMRQLTAAFNRGYRSFASVYATCTDSAIAAEGQYRREGATLAREIAAKYGN